MSLLDALRRGFSRTFWVANVLELFERFAYYSSKAILAVFIAEQVGLGSETATFLAGSVFNTLLYFLPVLAGTVVDRYRLQAQPDGLLRDLLGRLLPDRPRRAADGTSRSSRRWGEGVDGDGSRGDRDRRLAHQALDRGHGGADDHGRDEGPRLLDLLHAREHRRRGGPLHRARGARERGDLLRARGLLADQPRPLHLHGALLQGAAPSRGRSARPLDGEGPRRHGARLRQLPLHPLPRHLLGLLGDVLARLLRPALLRQGLPEVRALRGDRDRGRDDDHRGDHPRHRDREAPGAALRHGARLRPRHLVLVRHGRGARPSPARWRR